MAALALAVLGCAPTDHRFADVQLDLPGALPEAASVVRICVDGVGEREFGARLTGRFSMTGLPPGEPVDVAVDVLDEDGELLTVGWADDLLEHGVGTRSECSAGAVCAPCSAGSSGPEADDAWLLAVRFAP